MERIVILVVDDEAVIRDGIKRVLEGDLFEVETCRSGHAAIERLQEKDYGLIITDLKMPGMNGIECIRQVKDKSPDTQFMMFTVYENDEKVFEALKAGASGYLLKNTGLLQMIEALKELHEGGSPMSSNIARKLVSVFREKENVLPQVHALSTRENEVLQLLSKGLLYKEIADQLSISIATVRQHIHKIYEKLHVQNRTEALNKVYGK